MWRVSDRPGRAYVVGDSFKCFVKTEDCDLNSNLQQRAGFMYYLVAPFSTSHDQQLPKETFFGVDERTKMAAAFQTSTAVRVTLK